ncbi:MAG TPA: hypothetical protein VHL98_17210 [Microvirga sp.]|jgi:hypothetical protein|nr:hypothetical protein [Microvirga sp.]
MTSPRKIAANRQNAQRSTGPRTAAGKQLVSQNACRHGLATDAMAVPHLAAEADRLARAIAEPVAGRPSSYAEALTYAAAAIAFARTQRAREDVLQEIQAALVSPDPNTSSIVPALCRRLARIDRYEQRAASRSARALVGLREITPSDAHL